MHAAAHRKGKLCLVLDLDHTLLNSARYAEVGPELNDRLERRCAAEEQAGIPEMDRLLFRLDEIKVVSGAPSFGFSGVRARHSVVQDIRT